MATLSALTTRLTRRFASVTEQPTLAITAGDIMADTFEQLGYADSADVPLTDNNRLLAYASAELATVIALDAARFFSYTDGEESVDKSMISKEYREFASQFRADYEAESAKRVDAPVGSMFRVMKRIDRP